MARADSRAQRYDQGRRRTDWFAGPFLRNTNRLAMSDVRNERSNAMVPMRGFISRVTVEDAWQWTDKNSHILSSVLVPLENLAGRVLAEDVRTSRDLSGR